jgi:hypothetical protein
VCGVNHILSEIAANIQCLAAVRLHWTADLDALLAGNTDKAAREQLTLIRIFEELRRRDV